MSLPTIRTTNGHRPADGARVLIVDPQPLVRAGLRQALADVPGLRVVSEAATAAQARRETLRAQPHVALVGTRLPDGDGIDVCARLRTEHPEVTVVLCGAELTAGLLPEARLVGAAGVLSRSADLDRIRSAITAAACGEDHPSLWPDVSPDDVPPGETLTDREAQVVSLAAEGKTNAEIGDLLGIVEDTVKTHVQNAMRKLHASNRAHLVTVALRKNLLPPPRAIETSTSPAAAEALTGT